MSDEPNTEDELEIELEPIESDEPAVFIPAALVYDRSMTDAEFVAVVKALADEQDEMTARFEAIEREGS